MIGYSGLRWQSLDWATSDVTTQSSDLGPRHSLISFLSPFSLTVEQIAFACIISYTRLYSPFPTMNQVFSSRITLISFLRDFPLMDADFCGCFFQISFFLIFLVKVF